eukprot:6306622-Karenia_brevis.AAC.1
MRPSLRSGLVFDVISFNAAIEDVARKEDQSVGAQRNHPQHSDVVSFRAAISACEKGGQWQRVAPISNEKRREGFLPRRDHLQCVQFSVRE